ncbi:glyoxylate reductase/hydroxypyruvate reductase-like [Leptidea sinapis]|uniref:glyoxylate reductase/hydroxypyruvate reductase-like n=1 Tax=Leptidea sinapis TaxID=189913 RepID=UPI0021286645|nr:glyoxylate reductase/hydroxypyruvate reductase-like [Leptidea sinapis]XP_050677222.1 glyoxylate reductase/hydroxypyruvate reductase-like [Leptidea sinapis]
MSLKRVLVVNKTFPKAGLELLQTKLEATVLPYLDHQPECLPTIKKNIFGYDALIWNTKHKLTEEILDLAGPQLKVVTAMASGFDHIDVAELIRRGLPLGNTPNVLDDAVADITVGLLIGAARGFKAGIQEVERGQWKYGVQWSLGRHIAGSTVGIVGLGGVGQAVVQRLKAFNVGKFIYSGRSDKPEAASLGAVRVSLEDLLKESDFVVLCCPFTPETKHLITAERLKMMKNTAVLVNIARGGVIDQDALYEALKEQRIFAAGLDVTTPEPIPQDHPLVALPNCFILPHLGSATVETRDAMAKMSATNVILALEGKPMLHQVC